MKWGAAATRLLLVASMVILPQQPNEAGAAGVYENAAAEPAFLLSGRRTGLRADLDFSRNDPVEGYVYRVGAMFPLRRAFMVGLEQTFVSRSDSTDIEGGVGDLCVRASARAWHGPGWAISFSGYLVTGTTKQEYFPYSSKTLDVNASLAFVDTLGHATVYATAGRTWINRGQEERPPDERHADYWRASAGASVGSGDVRGNGGILYQHTAEATERFVWWGGAAVIVSDALVLHTNVQFETGKQAQRVSDWAASAGFTVRF